MKKISVTREAHFNAAHRLFNPNWDETRNREVFGKCYSPNFHGHNYRLEVTITGPVNPETGYVMDFKVLKRIIREEVEDRFDHKNLNLDTPFFKDLNPTAEHLVMIIYDLLRQRLDNKFSLSVRLWETERDSVTYPA